MKKRKQGIKVTVYLPESLISKWDSIKNKSKVVQEAVTNASEGV